MNLRAFFNKRNYSSYVASFHQEKVPVTQAWFLSIHVDLVGEGFWQKLSCDEEKQEGKKTTILIKCTQEPLQYLVLATGNVKEKLHIEGSRVNSRNKQNVKGKFGQQNTTNDKYWRRGHTRHNDIGHEEQKCRLIEKMPRKWAFHPREWLAHLVKKDMLLLFANSGYLVVYAHLSARDR